MARLVTAHEITELENAKAEIVEREGQLNVILNSFSDGFFIIDKEFTILRANELFKTTVEKTTEQVIGNKLLKVLPSLEGSIMLIQYSNAINNKEAIHFETNGVKEPDKWFRISAYPFDNGLSVFFRDITNEKEHELEIFKNEQNLISLINNTEDLIWSIDSEYNYFTYNQAHENNYRIVFKEDIYIGKSALNVNAGEMHMVQWKPHYDRALAGEKFSIELDLIVPPDHLYHGFISFNPIYNAEGIVIGVGCFLRDITQRRQHEEEIKKQNKKLKDIAFITSHSLRAPLANILGLTEILDKKNLACKENEDVIDNLKISAQQLDVVIRNIVNRTALLEEEAF
jgi:PAS domain S-box-containing protein